jgi:hypothetical protein
MASKFPLTDFELGMYNKFPKWFKGLKQTPQESCLSFGFEVGEGWHPIIEKLCDDIKDLIGDEPFEFAQVKEKYGSLRIYYDGCSRSDVRNLILQAENDSLKKCEICGNPGKLRTKGWVKTLCDLHHIEREEKYKEHVESFNKK